MTDGQLIPRLLSSYLSINAALLISLTSFHPSHLLSININLQLQYGKRLPILYLFFYPFLKRDPSPDNRIRVFTIVHGE